jgi:RNA recognition motif-containing protein
LHPSLQHARKSYKGARFELESAPAREFPPCLPLALRRLRVTPPKTATSEISATGRRLNSARFFYFFCEYSEVTKLYVGNLPFTATEDSVRALFAPHGTVEKISLISDRETGRPRGFGFVEMSNADASRAMQALNGQDFDGRSLKINEAQDRAGGGNGGGRGPRRY